jgi:hypothetical protein
MSSNSYLTYEKTISIIYWMLELYRYMKELPPITEENIAPPIGDPDECVPVEFAFREKVRNWWNRVAGNKCQYEYYDEKRGWVECDQKSEQVHHLMPESWQLEHGLDPEHSTGLPLCQHHHANFTEQTYTPEEHSKHFSFHPDMGKARKDYGQWKQQRQQTPDFKEPDPFAKTANGHRELSKKGKRFWAGTDDVDNFYREKMETKAVRYVAQTKDKFPQTPPHSHHEPEKKQKWYDEYDEYNSS